MGGAVWGRDTITRTVGSGLFICPTERDYRAYWQYRERSWRTLFKLPVFPGAVVSDYVECFRCKSTWDPRIVGSEHPSLWVNPRH